MTLPCNKVYDDHNVPVSRQFRVQITPAVFAPQGQRLPPRAYWYAHLTRAHRDRRMAMAMPLPDRLIPNLYDLPVDFVGNLKIICLS
jgi:hypothetical protein